MFCGLLQVYIEHVFIEIATVHSFLGFLRKNMGKILKSNQCKKMLLASGYFMSFICLFVSIGLVYSVSSGEAPLIITELRDVAVYPVIFISYLTIGLSAITLLMSIIQRDKLYKKALSILLIFSFIVSLYCSTYFLQNCSYPYNRVKCRIQLRNLYDAMIAYYNEYDAYPDTNQWCDELYQHLKIRMPNYNFDYRFKCTGGEEGRSNFALNPTVTEESSGNTVWIFDSKAGWNLNGGEDLVNFDNHEDKCINVLFHNGDVMYVEKDKLKDLNWGVMAHPFVGR